MSTNRFITLVNGIRTLVTAVATSAGAIDAFKIISTGSDGRLSMTFMPVGVGSSAVSIVASENLVAGDLVNIWNNSGVRNARKADATNSRPAHGFVLAAVSSGQSATVFQQGENTSLSGLTPGAILFLGTAGAVTATAPSGTNNLVQEVGFALSSTSILFEYDGYTVLN
jgi:hypothetical protein